MVMSENKANYSAFDPDNESYVWYHLGFIRFHTSSVLMGMTRIKMGLLIF